MAARCGGANSGYSRVLDSRRAHGANEVYLDRNYGGILIIWDRIFGTYQRHKLGYVFRGPGWVAGRQQ